MSVARIAPDVAPVRPVLASRLLRASRLPDGAASRLLRASRRQAASRGAFARARTNRTAPRRAARPLARGQRMVAVALGAILVSARVVAAQPSPTKVTGCEFDTAALERALDVEQQGRAPAPTITVTCDATTATITLHHADRPPTLRTVDLADVPAPLAPRVVALVAVAAAHEPAEGSDRSGPADQPSVDGRAPTNPDRDAGANGGREVTAPADGGRVEERASPGNTARAVDRPEGPVPSRASLVRDGIGPMRVTGVVGRGLVRVHDGQTRLWGAGAALTLGPASIGVTAAGTRIEHTLGTLTPWLAAADAGVTVACAGLACIGVRGELGRIWVAGDASDPMLVTSETLSATYLHGAAEVSFDARLGGVDVAATAALGASRGVIARAGAEAAAVLAGWTLTGAIEVRR